MIPNLRMESSLKSKLADFFDAKIKRNIINGPESLYWNTNCQNITKLL